MEEIFIKLSAYPNYEVSNTGFIRNTITGKLLVTTRHSVVFTKTDENNKKVLCRENVPRLVATIFIPNPQNFPVARVIDESCENMFSADNLKWCFKSKDLTGEVHDMLTVGELLNCDGRPYYKCKCVCGKVVTRSRTYFISSVKNKSCGCAANLPRKHGMAEGVTYVRWSAMKTRATNPNFIRADCYTEKGITLCSKWLTFEGFFEDMGECPSKKHSLDRIDSNGNYCKSNCRWVTQKLQTFNKSSKNERVGKITGVHKRKCGTWEARWRQDDKEGSKVFKNFIDAVICRRNKELEIYGETRIDLDSVCEAVYN